MGVKLKGISDVDGSTVEIDADDLKGGTGGGSGDLSAINLLKFDFSFDTPGLNQGINIYTPKVGDVLYNLWIDVITPFDGVTPQADVSIADSPLGLVAGISPIGPYKLDDPINNGRITPTRFIDTNSVKVYVSQDGKCDGTGIPINSTVGDATIFMILFPVS